VDVLPLVKLELWFKRTNNLLAIHLGLNG